MSDPEITSQDNVLIRFWRALWIGRDAEIALECLPHSYVRPGVTGTVTMSPETYVGHVNKVTADLRGTSIDVDQLHSVGDMLFARFTMRGVNVTTGGTIAIAWIVHYRLVDGKLAESWTMRQSDFAW